MPVGIHLVQHIHQYGVLNKTVNSLGTVDVLTVVCLQRVVIGLLLFRLMVSRVAGIKLATIFCVISAGESSWRTYRPVQRICVSNVPTASRCLTHRARNSLVNRWLFSTKITGVCGLSFVKPLFDFISIPGTAPVGNIKAFWELTLVFKAVDSTHR